jgi:hypothetical protein
MLSAVISMAPVATFGGQASGWNQFYVMRRFIGPLSSALSELITLGGTHLMLCPPLPQGYYDGIAFDYCQKRNHRSE